MADPTNIVLPRRDGQRPFIAIYAAIAWFAPNTQEIDGLRSQEQ